MLTLYHCQHHSKVVVVESWAEVVVLDYFKTFKINRLSHLILFSKKK